MPTGGLLIPRPKEQWEQAKTLYLDGKPWKEIAAITGIKAEVLMTKASTNKWTALRAQQRQEAQLESLRPNLHKHLHKISDSVHIPKTKSASKLREVADLVHTIAQATKLVEGWQDQQEQTLVNVLQISNSVTANPPKPVPEQPAIDVQAELSGIQRESHVSANPQRHEARIYG